jgi:hypothetical protein
MDVSGLKIFDYWFLPGTRPTRQRQYKQAGTGRAAQFKGSENNTCYSQADFPYVNPRAGIYRLVLSSRRDLVYFFCINLVAKNC